VSLIRTLGEVYFIQQFVMKFVSDLLSVVLSTNKLTAWYTWNTF